LTGVTCLPAGTCVAVGWYYYGATTSTQTLAIRWNGHAWLAIPAPSHGHRSQLDGVSCPVIGLCQAGSLPIRTGPVAARWNGRMWQAERVPGPTPVPQTLTLAAISCATVWFCMAVGDASRGAKARPSPSYRDTTLAERWNGSPLGRQPVDDPAPACPAGSAGRGAPRPAGQRVVCVGHGLRNRRQ
jgi:hypothetical protein